MFKNARAYSKQLRREFQKLLRQESKYGGSVDGSFGRGTRSAIQALYAGREKPD
jgi:hypothetical protein